MLHLEEALFETFDAELGKLPAAAPATRIRRVLDKRGAPAVVLNCAGYTNVDRAETQRDIAFALNGEAVAHIARACAALGAQLVHVSTDYVFDGTKGAPYVETDAPNPIQVYGESKLAGEALAREAVRWAVVRTCGLYGEHPCLGKDGANFVTKVLARARQTGAVDVVDDEFVSPTWTMDLARQLVAIAEAGATGIFHAANKGPVSWFEFAQAAVEISGLKAEVRRTSAAKFAAPAKRPRYSALANARLGQLGLDRMPSCRDALNGYLAAGVT